MAIETTKIVRVGNTQVALGLRWTLANVDDDDVQLWAKSRAEAAGSRYGFYVESSGELDGRAVTMGRLGLLYDSTVKPPFYSAAAWLASRSSVPTVYLMSIEGPRGEDLWWVCYTDASGVDTRTDRVDGEAALDLFNSLTGELQSLRYSNTEVRCIIIGEQMPQTNPWHQYREAHPQTVQQVAHLGDLLAGSPPVQAKAVQMYGIRPMTVYVIVGVLLAIVLGTGAMVYAKQAAEAKRQEQERLAAIAADAEAARLASLREVRKVQAIKAALAADTQTPEPGEIVERCLTGASLLGNRYAGWMVERMNCEATGRTLEASLKLATGADFFEPNAVLMTQSQLDGYEVSIDMAANRAVLRMPLGGPMATRPGLGLRQLPGVMSLQALDVSVLQEMQHYVPDVVVAVTPPEAKAIQFADPAYDAEPSSPERMKTVPEAEAYRTGVMRITGRSSMPLAEIASRSAYISLGSLALAPQGANDFDFILEERYVISSN